MIKVTILGSGTSHGVPMIACKCDVCTSSDPRNHRTRPSITVEGPGGTILVDAGPELRIQALRCGLAQVDAVLITHTHFDHLFGLDDIRRFNAISGRCMPIYADPAALEDIRRVYAYAFRETQEGGGKPSFCLREVPPVMSLCGMEVRAFTVMHGDLPIQAYRFGDVAYVTDVNRIPEEAMAQLQGLDTLILDAVRRDPHPTHFGLFEALDVIRDLAPRQAFLTHLSHHMEHQAISDELPRGVALAYDGLQFSA